VDYGLTGKANTLKMTLIVDEYPRFEGVFNLRFATILSTFKQFTENSMYVYFEFRYPKIIRRYFTTGEMNHVSVV